MHFAHARMGCIELVAQPLRSFAGGLGRDNGALAGPELGSERLGAHGSGQGQRPGRWRAPRDQGAGEEIERPRSEEHTSELQSLMRHSYAVFSLKKTNHKRTQKTH